MPAVPVSPVGTVGAVVSAGVRMLSADDAALTLPAASTARTVNEYSVFGDNPVAVYAVPATVASNVVPRYTRYDTTPTLSVDAFHANANDVTVELVDRSDTGTDGAVVSAGVRMLSADDAALTLPAASTARTVNEYSVFGDNPVAVYAVPATVASNVVPRYTRYDTTPTLSVDAFHANANDVTVELVDRSDTGTDGAVVSGGSGVRTTNGSLSGPTLPAASTASTR